MVPPELEPNFARPVAIVELVAMFVMVCVVLNAISSPDAVFPVLLFRVVIVQAVPSTLAFPVTVNVVIVNALIVLDAPLTVIVVMAPVKLLIVLLEPVTLIVVA